MSKIFSNEKIQPHFFEIWREIGGESGQLALTLQRGRWWVSEGEDVAVLNRKELIKLLVFRGEFPFFYDIFCIYLHYVIIVDIFKTTITLDCCQFPFTLQSKHITAYFNFPWIFLFSFRGFSNANHAIHNVIIITYIT